MVQEGSALLQTGTGQEVCRRRREGFRRESFGTFLRGQVTSVVGDVCFCYFMPGKAMKNMQKKLKLEDCASVIFCREMIHLRGEPEKCGRTAFLFLHPSYFFLLQKRGCTGKILFLANFFSLSGTSLFSP